MKLKNLLFITLLFGICIPNLHAQYLNIAENNDSQASFLLSDIKKISFTSGNITISKTNDNTSEFALSNMRYLIFSDLPIFTELPTNLNAPISILNQLLQTYPNPVSNQLNINLGNTNELVGTISITNSNGKIVLQKQTQNEEIVSLNMSDLPRGIYICKYYNALQVKTVTIIKK